MTTERTVLCSQVSSRGEHQAEYLLEWTEAPDPWPQQRLICADDAMYAIDGILKQDGVNGLMIQRL